MNITKWWCNDCKLLQDTEAHKCIEKGTKYDEGKARFDLLPYDAITGIASVMAFGAQKYGENNWRNIQEAGRYFAACMRHLAAWQEGETFDGDSGRSHLYHAGANILMLASLTEKHPNTDTRYATKITRRTLDERPYNPMEPHRPEGTTIPDYKDGGREDYSAKQNFGNGKIEYPGGRSSLRSNGLHVQNDGPVSPGTPGSPGAQTLT